MYKLETRALSRDSGVCISSRKPGEKLYMTRGDTRV